MRPRNEMTETMGTSPSASGPSGALFEAKVDAHVLLTMLGKANPRRWPGLAIGRVELQRAGKGHPLNGEVVRGTAPAVS